MVPERNRRFGVGDPHTLNDPLAPFLCPRNAKLALTCTSLWAVTARILKYLHCFYGHNSASYSLGLPNRLEEVGGLSASGHHVFFQALLQWMGRMDYMCLCHSKVPGGLPKVVADPCSCVQESFLCNPSLQAVEPFGT